MSVIGTRRMGVLLALLLTSAPLRAQGVFAGVLVDSRRRTPLACVDVALEDSAAHEVAHTQTTGNGAFQFDSPPAGSFRPRFSVWLHAPVYGAYETLDSTSQHARVYQVDFGPFIKEKLKLWPDTVDSPPGKPLHPDRVRPTYPPELRMQRVQGSVSMRFVVDSTGSVVPLTMQVLESSHPDFAAAALRYFREVQYEPARRGGRPVCALLTDWPLTFGIS
jgi:TonB family protein